MIRRRPYTNTHHYRIHVCTMKSSSNADYTDASVTRRDVSPACCVAS